MLNSLNLLSNRAPIYLLVEVNERVTGRPFKREAIKNGELNTSWTMLNHCAVPHPLE